MFLFKLFLCGFASCYLNYYYYYYWTYYFFYLFIFSTCFMLAMIIIDLEYVSRAVGVKLDASQSQGSMHTHTFTHILT